MNVEMVDQHVLLVHLDEEKKFVERFKSVFEEKGFSITHVPTFDEAYKELGQHSVDMIVLDMTGEYQQAFQFCAAVRRNKNLASIKIIVLSDVNDKFGILLEAKTKEAKRWLNADLYVHKPVTSKSLYQLIKKETATATGISSMDLDADGEYGR